MKEIKSFWIYQDRFAVIDAFNTVWAIGSFGEMTEKAEIMNSQEEYSYYGPVEVVRISNETSVVYERKY